MGSQLLQNTEIIKQTDVLLWKKISRSERGYLVRILASRPGVPGSNPIPTPKSLVMD